MRVNWFVNEGVTEQLEHLLTLGKQLPAVASLGIVLGHCMTLPELYLYFFEMLLSYQKKRVVGSRVSMVNKA